MSAQCPRLSPTDTWSASAGTLSLITNLELVQFPVRRS